MADWHRITAHIKSAKTLTTEQLIDELEDLRVQDPDTANELTQYFERRGVIGEFMQTSMPGTAIAETYFEPGEQLGVWRIVGLIGSGGMGDVYKAERSDGLYDQVVALKVIQRGDADSLKRFEDERKRLANLEHSGISRIIDGGATEDGRPYMVMEYVEGRAIDDYIRAEKLTRPQSLALFNDLCASVAHAHSKLILHRDIKTTNVLVDAAGSAKLIDFGIASVMGETSEGYGGPITIAYAAPEQLMRKTPSVGSDIFALGVLLHEIMTSAPPHRNSNGSVTVDEHKVADADISAIITKTTAFDVNDRYQSVTALSDDIDAYLETRPVAARNGTGAYRFKKYIRRNALASALAAAFVVALTGGMVTSLVMANKAALEAKRANAEAARANSETERANAELFLAEWNADVASTLSFIDGARADSFQYVFAQMQDQQFVSNRLKDYVDAITDDDIENNPKMAATKTFVVGKYFLTRNDYLTARQIFEPWLQADYGKPLTRAYGQTSLAFAYRNLGETELALGMFQKAENFYIGTPLENTIEHAANAIQIGLLSEDANEIERARKIIRMVLDTDSSPYNRLYLLNQTYAIETKNRNWDAAYSTQKQHTELVDSGHLGRTEGTDSSHLNFAAINLFYKQDYALALKHIEIAQDISLKKKGEGNTLGRIYEIRATLDWVNEDYEAALDHISQSLSIFEKYTGKTGYYSGALAQQGIIQTDAGDFVAANKSRLLLTTGLGETSGQWPDILELYITARRDGVKAAQKIYDDPSFDRDNIQGNLSQVYYLKILEKNGLKL